VPVQGARAQLVEPGQLEDGVAGEDARRGEEGYDEVQVVLPVVGGCRYFMSLKTYVRTY